MRIGLIADTHIPESRRELWPQVFEAFAGVECILHGGDVHEVSVIDALNAVAPIYVARGNGDDGSGGRPVLPEDDRIRDVWSLELGGLSIGVIHIAPVPERPPHHTIARLVAGSFGGVGPDVLIYGDTHVEAIDTIDGVLCVNPGSPTYPHNLDTQLGTIGFLEIGEGRPVATIWQLTTDGIAPFAIAGRPAGE